MISVRITYDTVSEVSVVHGDTADHGFADEYGGLYSIADDGFQALVKRLGHIRAVQHQAMEAGQIDFRSLRECVRWLDAHGPYDSIGDQWLTQVDINDYDEPRFSYHLKGDERAVGAVLNAVKR